MCWKMTEQGIWLCDTPGLSDALSYKACAAEISKALREAAEPFGLLFVVRLEAARVVGDDVATMKAVLEALGQEVDYGVVVNKVTAGTLRGLNRENRRTVEFVLGEALPCKPQSFCYLPFEECLDGRGLEAGDTLLVHPPLPVLVLMAGLKQNHTDLSKVKDVESDYEKHRKEAEACKAEMGDLQERLEQNEANAVAQRREYAEEAARRERQHEKALEELRSQKKGLGLFDVLGFVVVHLL
eukprot:TRINITY_DN4014_c0_g5_i2.p1 TRINITY_DN4014_c0_g5~~TRINITY_DN4014_c0_g5_i2.p1  ORF type:complete len:241 (+),score=77.52 TRINITY_DN4014_c0_g5_i2:626-1348(+)